MSVIVMNPQNGEIMAMVNYPEFNLNEPFTLIEEMGSGWDGVCGQKAGTAEPHVEKPSVSATPMSRVPHLRLSRRRQRSRRAWCR